MTYLNYITLYGLSLIFLAFPPKILLFILSQFHILLLHNHYITLVASYTSHNVSLPLLPFIALKRWRRFQRGSSNGTVSIFLSRAQRNT